MSLTKIAELPTQELLKKLLTYKDGNLYWNAISLEDTQYLGD